MNSSTIRWLIDAENGGPPRAYECLLVTGLGYSSDLVCGKVTRTLSGMRSHQRSVHSFEPQEKLFRGAESDRGRESYAEGSETPLK